MLSDHPLDPVKITIITPSYNQAEFLEQCILSVLDQNYPNLEYFIIDGGSTDDSVKIIQKYAPKIAYWVSEPDRGQSDAINKGMRRATGQLVAWLNSDDFYLPGTFEAVNSIFHNQPSAPFYYGNGWRVDRRGFRKSLFYPEDYLSFNRPALIYGLNYILQPSTFILRSALDQIGYLDESLRYGMDTDLWIRLSELGDPVTMNIPLSSSREYSDTKTSSGSFERFEELRAIAEKYGGEPVTPGIICYFLDTLRNYVQVQPDLFPSNYTQQLDTFWASTSELMRWVGARNNGNPLNNHRIGVEMRQIKHGPSGGISYHTKGILEALFKLYPDYEFFIFGTIFNQDLFTSLHPNVHLFSLPTISYFSELDQILRKENIDILFRTYPSQQALEFPIRRQIFHIPDIQHDTFPEFFTPQVLEARRQAFRIAMQGAGAIGTLTNFTRNTILHHPDNQCQDVFLFPPGVNSETTLVVENQLLPDELSLIPEGEYFYYPGNLWPHKNHRRTLQAFDLFLKKSDRQMEFILSGHPDGWNELRVDFSSLPVRHLGFVRPAVVKHLLRNATGVTFFSLYEGFGMPLLEAFDAGVPVICSNTTSLPEVGEGAVLSCDPTDLEAMSELMLIVSQDLSLRERMVANGKLRLNEFSWESSAQALMEAVQRVSKKQELTKPHRQTDTLEEIELPWVTIVTPSYNQGRFLKRTIESVLNQSYPRIEYIVLDGGSTDESLEILESYGNRFYWKSEPDRGQTHAINKGLAMARGEIFAYLNSDDVLLPGAIETVVSFFLKRPDVDMVYGRAQYIDENDRVTGMYKTDEYSFARLVYDNCICQPAAFWRKRLAEKIGPFDESLHYAMDHEYWMRMDRSGAKIMHIHNILASSRLYAETKTLSAREKIYAEIFKISQKHAGYISISYFQGLWHHRIWEKPESRYRLLRWIPGTFITVANIHHTVYHRHWPNRLKPINILRQFVQSIYMISSKYLGMFRPIVRKFRSNWFIVNVKNPVFGFYPDNWIGPVFQVYIKTKEPGQQFFIGGIPTLTMELHIKQDSQPVRTLLLEEDHYIRIPFDAQNGQRISLSFSRAKPDQTGRYKTLLVKETNLFSEQDLPF